MCIRARPRSRSCSLGSLGRAVVVIEFIWVRWGYSGAPCGSLGSRPGSNSTYGRSLGSFMLGLWVVVFIWVRRVHLGGALGLVMFIWARCGYCWVY